MSQNRSALQMYQEVLGPGLKAFWDARSGISLFSGEVDTWTDQIGNWSLQFVSNRPTFVADPPYFKNLPLVGLTNAGGKRMNITLTPPYIVPLGERPMVFMLARLPIFGAGNRWLLRTTDAAYTQEGAGFYIAAGNTLVATFSGENPTAPFSSTGPHTIMSWFETSNGQRSCAIDSSTVVLGGVGAALLKEIGRVIVGGDGTSANVQDANIAMIGIVNPAPDAGTRAKLISLIEQDWGVLAGPPLPASTFEWWWADAQASPTQVIGQRRGIVLPGFNAPTVAPDPGYFNNRNVFQTSTIGQKDWFVSGVSGLNTGMFPWIYVVGRYKTLSTDVRLFGLGAAGRSESDLWIRSSALAALINSGVSGYIFGPPQNTLPHRFKLWATGTGTTAGNLAVDDTVYTGGGGGLGSVPSNFAIGCNPQLQTAQVANGSVGIAIVCTSKPTASEEAALDAWAKAYYGVP